MSEMPTWEGFLVPVLKALSDGVTRPRSEMSDLAADVVGLSEDQRKVMLGSGQPMYANRVGWLRPSWTRRSRSARALLASARRCPRSSSRACREPDYPGAPCCRRNHGDDSSH